MAAQDRREHPYPGASNPANPIEAFKSGTKTLLNVPPHSSANAEQLAHGRGHPTKHSAPAAPLQANPNTPKRTSVPQIAHGHRPPDHYYGSTDLADKLGAEAAWGGSMKLPGDKLHTCKPGKC